MGRSRQAVAKRGDDPIALLSKRAQPQPVANVVFANAPARCLQQQRLQPAAMDGILRPVVARGNATLLAVDELAELVEVTQDAGRNSGAGKLVAETELRELAHRRRLQIDADAERRRVAHGLINADRDSCL